MTGQVKTVSGEKVWSTPDGKIKIFTVVLDYDGKPVSAKTYSEAIATPGWEGEVESYEKQGRNGMQTFVKQPPKEDGSYSPKGTGSSGTSGGAGRSSYQPKDEKAIQAMWSISQAVALLTGLSDGKLLKGDVVGEVEAKAQQLFNMVDRVKATPSDLDTVVPVKDDSQITIDDIKDVLAIEDDNGPET